ncbi:TetR/AcrR family transcriptional regulator [Solibacillus sp. FSL H8-0538]|uniref:TetR/AcrR family transcriptional regulator n=1 Tax=Solibacillus sp. FSL H8-0538 TaxID=2921400 RepID=UPI0030FA6791
MARGRRVNSSGEKSKQLLLEKAIEQFSTYGYHQTKISDIVKAANLTQPTFYLYFKSKESLFKDLNEQFQNDLGEVFSDGYTAKKNDSNGMKNHIQENLTRIFSYFVENPKLTKIGFYESEQAADVKEMLVTRLLNEIENEQHQINTLTHVDTRILADSLLGSMERLTWTTLLTEKSNPEKLSEDIVNIYFA